ncbi:hypothetical protein VNO77_27912 [Canavalia gladiata]|uniref:Uncharacterized protein n=1 Tax=Canavalia gladiata TaxID=3824 RepID=A0AAN9Q6Y0_CANGL
MYNMYAKVIHTLTPRSESIECVGFAPSVRLWDSRWGECVKKLTAHCGAIQSLSVSADQSFIVSASFDGNAIAYDMRM